MADVLLRRGKPKDAVRAYQRAFAFAEAGHYRRGQAHAYAGVARCAAAVEEWPCRNRSTPRRSPSTKSSAISWVGPGRSPDWPRALTPRATTVGCRTCISTPWRPLRQCAPSIPGTTFSASTASASPPRTARPCAPRFVRIDPEAFVAVFEGMAGRRLAGLLERVVDDKGEAELLGQLVARADQRWTERHPVAGTDRRTRLIRMLGAASLRAGLAAPAREALEEAVSSLYQPFDPASAAALLGGSAAGAHLLLLSLVPGAETEVARLWRSPEGVARIDIHQLDIDAVALLASLGERGMAPTARPVDLVPLADLLPEGMGEAVGKGDPALVIVPLGGLWSVPWPAVPLPDRRFLGEAARLAIAPSLTVNSRVAARPLRRPTGRPLNVACWRSPDIVFHDLEIFDEHRWQRRALAAAWEAREAVTAGLDDVVVLAGHGLALDGVGHYLELAPGEPLTPADLLGATAPELLVLVACWGAATPASAPSDPLTLATMALAAGSRQVGATVAELGDNLRASRFVELVIDRLAGSPMPDAIRDATAAFLADERIRTGPLKDWAPIVTVGAL